jgi:hypothetical protein
VKECSSHFYPCMLLVDVLQFQRSLRHFDELPQQPLPGFLKRLSSREELRIANEIATAKFDAYTKTMEGMSCYVFVHCCYIKL